MFNGYMRKVAFPLVGLVAIGWLLIVIGFGIETVEDNVSATGNFRYSWWMVIMVTPFMLIMAVVQAAIDRKKIIMNLIGAITTFLSALFLTALGYLIITLGILIQALEGSDIPAAYSLEFSGAFIAGLFWVALTCLSHFYMPIEHEDISR